MFEGICSFAARYPNEQLAIVLSNSKERYLLPHRNVFAAVCGCGDVAGLSVETGAGERSSIGKFFCGSDIQITRITILFAI